jgi:nicotinamidase-related amidase
VAHRIALPDWAVERGRMLNSVDALDPATTALVVIDMQRVFIGPDEVFANRHALDIIPTVNKLADAFRAVGAAVIWTRQTVDHTPPRRMPAWQYDLSIPAVREAVDTMTAGHRAHALHPRMRVVAGDAVIDKYRYGAFSCPEGRLEAALAARRIETLVIAGTLTNCCCDSTAREGNMRGYRTLLVSDATAAVTDEEHNAALLTVRINFADVRTAEETIALLPKQGAAKAYWMS